MPLAGLSGACVALGYTTSQAPVVAAALVGAFLLAIVFILAGRARFTSIVLASLPWLVVLNTLIPKLALTFTSATGALLLLSLTRPRFKPYSLVWIGTALFLMAVLVGALKSTTADQLVQAAKYTVLPAMALVVTSRAGREQLVSMRLTLLCSGVGAMAAQGVIILLHIGTTDAKYGAGEQLGFATQNPHELGLVGAMVAVACLVGIRNTRWRLIGATIAITPALATAVRSALVGLAASLLVLAIRARFRPSVVLGIGVLCAAIIFSGVGEIIATRYQQDQAKGEFSSTATLGSDRGALWTVALDHWSTSGPSGVVLGSGLRSIESIEKQGLFLQEATVQSDPIAVLVEIGIIGLVGWLLIWLALIRSGIEWLVIVPLASYAFSNGALEYVGATVFGIALAAACMSENKQDAPVEVSRRPPPSMSTEGEPRTP